MTLDAPFQLDMGRLEERFKKSLLDTDTLRPVSLSSARVSVETVQLDGQG